MLPKLLRSSCPLVDTGTAATSGLSGSVPRPRRYRRSAPAQSASTTSLTVTRNSRFTALMSSSGNDANPKQRSGVTGWLNSLRGAWNGRAGDPNHPIPSAASLNRSTTECA